MSSELESVTMIAAMTKALTHYFEGETLSLLSRVDHELSEVFMVGASLSLCDYIKLLAQMEGVQKPCVSGVACHARGGRTIKTLRRKLHGMCVMGWRELTTK